MLNKQTLPLPNPGDWTDAEGAAEILGRDRTTVYDYARRKVIKTYPIGVTERALFWVPELKEVRDAIARLGRG